MMTARLIRRTEIYFCERISPPPTFDLSMNEYHSPIRRLGHIALVLLLVLATLTAPVAAVRPVTSFLDATVSMGDLDDTAALEAFFDRELPASMERNHVPGAVLTVPVRYEWGWIPDGPAAINECPITFANILAVVHLTFTTVDHLSSSHERYESDSPDYVIYLELLCDFGYCNPQPRPKHLFIPSEKITQ